MAKPLHQRLGIRRWRYVRPSGTVGVIEEWRGHNKGEGLAVVASNMGHLDDFIGPIMAAGPDMIRLLKKVLRGSGGDGSCLKRCRPYGPPYEHELHDKIRALLKKLKVL